MAASYGELRYVVTVTEDGGSRDYPYVAEGRPLVERDVLQGQDLDGVVIVQVVTQSAVGVPGKALGERRKSGLRRP